MSDRMWFSPTNITPGQWRCSPNWETSEEIDVFRSTNGCYKAETVATVRRLDHVRDAECRGEIYANALAIAAVPDMIEALELAERALEFANVIAPVASDLAIVRNALRKARGEAREK